MVLFSAQEIGSRLAIDISGVIVKAETRPYNTGVLANPNRKYTEYLVRTMPGGQASKYVAGFTDSELYQNLHAGQTLEKKAWALSYSVDGEVIHDFSVWFYFTIMGIGILLVIVSIRSRVRSRRPNNSLEPTP